MPHPALIVSEQRPRAEEIDLDVLTQYAWIVWLVLILAFATIEVFTLEMTFLMLALGSVAGLLSGPLRHPVVGPVHHRRCRVGRAHPHIATAAASAAATRRRPCPQQRRRAHRGRRRGRSHRHAGGRPGSSPERRDLDGAPLPHHRAGGCRVGERVLVTGIDGATAVVVPVERTPPSDRQSSAPSSAWSSSRPSPSS